MTLIELIAYLCIFSAGADFGYLFHKGFSRRRAIMAAINLAIAVALIVFVKAR